MLNALVRGSLHYRVVVLIIAAVLLAVGVYSIHTAKYDVFPEFIPPMVVVQTEACKQANSEVLECTLGTWRWVPNPPCGSSSPTGWYLPPC